MTTLVELCASPDTTDDAKLTALDEAKARLTEAGHGLLWREDGTVEIVGIPQNGKGDWLRKTIKCDWYEMVPCTVEARLQGYIIWVDESGAPYLDEDHLSKHFGVSAETFRVLEGLLRQAFCDNGSVRLLQAGRETQKQECHDGLEARSHWRGPLR